MAEAFARMHGGRADAYSAGYRPPDQVHPRAVAAMRERGQGASATQVSSR